MKESPVQDLIRKVTQYQDYSQTPFPFDRAMEFYEEEITALERRLTAQVTHSYDEKQIRDAMEWLTREICNYADGDAISACIDRYLAEHPAPANYDTGYLNGLQEGKMIAKPIRKQVESLIRKVYYDGQYDGANEHFKVSPLVIYQKEIDELCGKEES